MGKSSAVKKLPVLLCINKLLFFFCGALTKVGFHKCHTSSRCGGSSGTRKIQSHTIFHPLFDPSLTPNVNTTN